MSVSETPDLSASAAGNDSTLDAPLVFGTHELSGRLVVGTGKYASFELMQECLEATEAEVVTVAVRRERLVDSDGRNILDFIDLSRYTILPNTAGCFSAEDAVRVARLGREILEGLENPGADWVKLEVLGDTRTLLPDPLATLEATRQLVDDGFQAFNAGRLSEACHIFTDKMLDPAHDTTIGLTIAGAMTPEQVVQNAAAAGWRLEADALAEVDRLSARSG